MDNGVSCERSATGVSQRGQLITEQMSFSLPGSWNVTSGLPTYQLAQSYNDANQPTTTTTSSTPSGQGTTSTQVYDSTTGVLTGLSNNGTASANLATLTYNARAQLNAINFQTNSGGAGPEQFGYDANLRTTSATASWQGGSGNSGTIFGQALSYDAASNLVSLSTTQNAVGSSAGGSETSNFCYDAQNRLVWAGNSGTQPGAGNGTCGSATLSSGLAGASYSDSFVYTNLGELWQGRFSGGSTQVQYLYCASNTHQLVGLYPISSGATCSNYTSKTASYSSSYDQWGNVTSRTANSTTATLTYDILDHLTQWYANNTNQEQYLYDASGERMLRRFTNSNGTTILTYPFGIEEHQYSGSGSSQWNIYYYFLVGRLLGSLDGNGTQFYLTDTLGSLVSAFNTSQGGALMKSNQLFGPYGNARYYACCINTAKGFIGQYNDGTGLDYFHARYYDPVAGMFLSVDTVQSNTQGINPYAYVNGNPETHSDPNGHMRMLVGSSAGGTDYITPASTAITIPSLFYGGLTSFASTKIAILRAYVGDPKYADPWIRTYVKNETGINNVAKRVANATSEVDALEGSARTLSHFGNILLGIGALLDGAISGMDYYNQHPDQGVASAIGVGVTHAALSTTGAYVGAIAGADFGAAVGTLLLPGVGTVVGAWVGGALGGALGGWAGDQLANSWSQAASTVGNWFGSLF